MVVSCQRVFMKKYLALILVIFMSPSYADDCPFDQDARIKENFERQHKYKGSRLIENNLVLVVPDKNGDVYINIGGCSHYGVNVEYHRSDVNKDMTENEFMKIILYLADKYSEENIDTKQLKEVINSQNWLQPDPSTLFYFFNYEELNTFEVYELMKDGRQVVGFNSYS